MDRRGRIMVNMIMNHRNIIAEAPNDDDIHHREKMCRLNENPDPTFVLNDSNSKQNDGVCDNNNCSEDKVQVHSEHAVNSVDLSVPENEVHITSSPVKTKLFESYQMSNMEECSGLSMINNNYGRGSTSSGASFCNPEPGFISLSGLEIQSSFLSSSVCQDIMREIEIEDSTSSKNQNDPHDSNLDILNFEDSSTPKSDFSPTDGSEYIPSVQDSDSTRSGDKMEYLYSNVPIISESEQNINLEGENITGQINDFRESPSILEETINGSELSTEDNEEEASGRPSRGRKRKCPQNRSERKLARNSNKEYFDHKLRSKQPKDFIDFNCLCKKKCKFSVPLQIRKQFFTKFWSLGSYNSQTSFIGVFVKEQRSEKSIKRKVFVRKYKIETFDVCRDMFCKTLNICSTRIATAMGKLNSRTPLLDQRGQKRAGENRVPESRKQEINGFINSIPLYTSHYSRANTGAKFFKPGVTLLCVYNEYKSKYNLNAVSYSFFKQYFYDNFNIKVKILSKDTCNVCDKSRIEIKNAEARHEDVYSFKESHKKHLQQAERARSEMKTDMNLAKNQNGIECITFDMQKTLPLPRLQTNVIFYKRQIWLYNLGVHSAKGNQSFCYTWVEGQAGRGAQEVGSCLIKHIRENVSRDVKHIILWSDSCGGQNRNIKITLLMKTVLENNPNLLSITFKYLIPGHSYLPNDKDFGDIERALKYNQRLYTPDDYLNIMKVCKKKSLITNKMVKEDFVSTEFLEKHIVNRKKTSTNNKINWLNTREIKITRDERYHIYMKNDFDQDDYKCLDISRKLSNRRQGADNFNNIDIFKSPLPNLWPNGKPIAEPKLRDILSIIHLITEDAKLFYNSLTSSLEAVDDIDGFNTELDFNLDEE